MVKGCFITIEGMEGVGKSTNIELVESILVARQISYISTREPGGTLLGEKIRELLLDKTESSMIGMTEILLIFAARAQHVAEVIKPAINKGVWVICDRFTDSSFAYQGAGRGLNPDLIRDLEASVLGGFSPDLTILLDLPVDIGLQRATKRGELDRFENENIEFFSRVRRGFLDRAAQFDRFSVVDAGRSLRDVQAEVSHVIEKCIEAWKA